MNPRLCTAAPGASKMRSVHAAGWMIALRISVLVALATSAALLVDYTSFNPAFCSPGSGCASVRASGFGYVAGVPVPLLGLLGFGLLYVLSLSKSPGAKRSIAPIAAAGGAVAVLLILLQAVVIGHICAYCVVVDLAAIAAAAAALAYKRAGGSKSTSAEVLPSFSWIALGAIAIGAPLIWPKVRPKPNVPPAIQAFYVAGKINVVEFADFQCPFCRMLHPQLKAITRDYPGQVNFVRMNMPLDRHAQAMGAARAYVCAGEQGKGEEMADALFETEELSVASNRRLAVQMALDADKFDACVKDPKTEAGVRKESQILRKAGFQGLPTTYVGNEIIVGAQGEEVFREAFDRAAKGAGNTGVPGWAFLIGVVVLAGAAIGIGRMRSDDDGRAVESKPSKKAAPRAKETEPDDDDGDDGDDVGDDEDEEDDDPSGPESVEDSEDEEDDDPSGPESVEDSEDEEDDSAS